MLHSNTSFDELSVCFQDALVDAIMQVDFASQPPPAWLHDLPQQIQHHQQKKKWKLHSTEQPSTQSHQQSKRQPPSEGWEEEEQEEEEDEEDSLRDSSALYDEEQQLKAKVEGRVEQLLGHLTEAAALQARTQERLQRSSAADESHAVPAAENVGLVQDNASE